MGLNRIVLAVEDDLQEQLQISRALAEIEGLTLVTVDTGGDALDYIHRRGPYEWRRPSEDPRLVIADHKLPDMLGIDLVRGVREHPDMQEVPMFIYGDELNGLERMYRDYTVDAPLPKPADAKAFCQALRLAVEKHLKPD